MILTLGDIIKKYRDEHGLSMDSFSEKSGISKAYISLLEKNKHPKTGKAIAPSVQCIKQAASGMDMDFNDLFCMIDGDVSLEELDSINFSNIGKVLKELRMKAGISQKQAHEYIGVAQSTFSSWEIGKAEPPINTFLKLCDLYQVDDILSAFGYDGYKEDGSLQLNVKEVDMVEKYRLISTHSPDGAVVVDTVLDREYAIAEKLREQKEQLEKVQRMDMEVAEEIVPFRIISYHQKLASAGNGQVVFDDGAVDRIQIPDIKKYKRVSYAIGVNGKSMEPLYHDGDILLIEPTCQVEIGEIGIFIVDGDAFVKKLGNGELISLNKGHGNIALTEYSNCMGRVVDKLKND